jgi:hypothetical protein
MFGTLRTRLMSDESPTQERTDKPITEGQTVARDVKTVVDHLRAGRTTSKEAWDVKQAAERTLTDRAIARAIRR